MSDTNRTQITPSVDDSLRDRIAAVVHDYSVPIPMAELVADALIEALGVRTPASYWYDKDGTADDERYSATE